MALWKSRKRNKYSGSTLSTEKIDARTQTNNHLRDERKKNAAVNIEVIAKYGAMIAVPLVFVGLVVADFIHNNYENLTTHLSAIGGSLVGYLFGKKTSDD